MSGKLIHVMYDDMAGAGRQYKVEFRSGELPDGMLIYRMSTDRETVVGRIVKIE